MTKIYANVVTLHCPVGPLSAQEAPEMNFIRRNLLAALASGAVAKAAASAASGWRGPETPVQPNHEVPMTTSTSYANALTDGSDPAATLDASTYGVQATNAPMHREMAQVFELSPEWFGAVGNGAVDDTAAINQYIAAVKQIGLAQNASVLAFRLRPGATYRISDSLRFGAASQTYNPVVKIFGNGAVITGTTPAGYAMVDCINTAATSTIENLMIIGQTGGAQGMGILHGYSQSINGGIGPYGDMTKTSVVVQGQFFYACTYNRGADCCISRDCVFNSTNPAGPNVGINAGGFSTITDPQGFWPILSHLATMQPMPVNPLGEVFDNCNIMSLYGTPIWISTPIGTMTFNSCYANSVFGAVPAVIIYISQVNAQFGCMNADMHFETGVLTHCFYINAPYATVAAPAQLVVARFKYKDLNIEPKTIFGVSPNIPYIRLDFVDLEIGFQFTGQTVFDNPAIYLVAGIVRAEIPGAGWNAPQMFNGSFYSSWPFSAYTFGPGTVLFNSSTANVTTIGGATPITINQPTLVNPVVQGTLMMEPRGGLVQTAAAPIQAAGTSYTSATQIPTQVSIVTGGTGGVVLPAAFFVQYTIYSLSTVAATVYGSGGRVVGTLAPGAVLRVYAMNATTYLVG